MADVIRADDVVEISGVALSPEQCAEIEATLKAVDALTQRAIRVHRRLSAILEAEHLATLGVRPYATMWDEPRIAAFEALIAQIPEHANELPTIPTPSA
jgi:hypothetical protein